VISPLLHEAINVYPAAWSAYLVGTFGLHDMHLENQTEHRVTQTIFTHVPHITIRDAELTSKVLKRLHNILFLRTSTRSIISAANSMALAKTRQSTGKKCGGDDGGGGGTHRAWDMINVLRQRCRDTERVGERRTYVNGIVYLIQREVIGQARTSVKEDSSKDSNSNTKAILRGWRSTLSKWCSHDSTSDSAVECCLLGRGIAAASLCMSDIVVVCDVVCEALDRLLSCASRIVTRGGGTIHTHTLPWMKEQLLESITHAVQCITRLFCASTLTITPPMVVLCASLAPLVEYLLLSTSELESNPAQDHRAALSAWRCGDAFDRSVQDRECATKQERAERAVHNTHFFESLATDQHPNVAGPPAARALLTMKESDPRMYYQRLRSVVAHARVVDDEEMLTDKLKLFTALSKQKECEQRGDDRRKPVVKMRS
jgi:hypothetical protein